MEAERKKGKEKVKLNIKVPTPFFHPLLFLKLRSSHRAQVVGMLGPLPEPVERDEVQMSSRCPSLPPCADLKLSHCPSRRHGSPEATISVSLSSFRSSVDVPQSNDGSQRVRKKQVWSSRVMPKSSSSPTNAALILDET